MKMVGSYGGLTTIHGTSSPQFLGRWLPHFYYSNDNNNVFLDSIWIDNLLYQLAFSNIQYACNDCVAYMVAVQIVMDWIWLSLARKICVTRRTLVFCLYCKRKERSTACCTSYFYWELEM